ncbi:L-rhamnose-proton symporter [Acidisarcina polymorpha]|uniref:L-rhamnose-proton symporter n=1 Tax=Acidisarcina polymorpha TaxID=2211140 RepID=A0A2Z5G892_9BACT|nr:L-rhamnose/proton symporter RhaT [Acidisarcina polymorpha]AXC15037.1 L-rhamnose-proton symporter [Acidisarcina polymorpha]
MQFNPLMGVFYHWLGGLASASCYLPFRGIKRWSWETYWLVQGTFSWILAPIIIASLLVPHVYSVLHAAPSSSLFFAYFWGCLWGIGGLTCGLSIRYLGFALGYPIVLGLCTVFGTIMPPVFSGTMSAILRENSGHVILLGLAVCVLGILFSGFAGRSKENELTESQKQETVQEFQYGKGLAVAVLSGIMSACFAYGLAAGKPIGEIAKAQLLANGGSDIWQNLPVLIVVMLGGFSTNFIWCAILLIRNRSAGQYLGTPARESGQNLLKAKLSTPLIDELAHPDDHPRPRLASRIMSLNYAFAALAGVTWYFQFFFYSMGQTKMGKYDFSSWTLHMASIMIFATIIGIFLKEWRGTSPRTRGLVAGGLFFLVLSTVVVGYGNYMKGHEDSVSATNR